MSGRLASAALLILAQMKNILLLLAFVASLHFSKGCDKRSGYDIQDNNLYAVHGKPEHECCGICQRESRCRAYAWNDYQGGTCWLKTATQPQIPVNGVSMGVVGGGGGSGGGKYKKKMFRILECTIKIIMVW